MVRSVKSLPLQQHGAAADCQRRHVSRRKVTQEEVVMVQDEDHLPPVNPYKMPVLPRQLRHMHQLHANKKQRGRTRSGGCRRR